jgi:hypothetical protein
MLLIKCPQCNRSYRLAESLYRRKAAGYGVVITCRHCKTQIHVDEGDIPAGTATDANDPTAFDVDEVTPPSGSAALPPEPSPADASAPESEPPPSSGQALPLVVKPPVQPAAPVVESDETQTLPPAAPVLPELPVQHAPAQSPAAARSVTAPRPAPLPPRPMGSATATPMPLRSTAGSATATPRPMASATATPMPFGTSAGSPTATPRPGSATATPMPFGGPAVPRPASAANATPLPLRGAVAPRPTNSTTATPLPRTGAQASNGARANATPTPSDTTLTPALGGASGMPIRPGDPLVTPTPDRAGKAKLVALSPGLLGVATALKETSSSPNASSETDSNPNSGVPLSIPDAELFDVDSKPPDSAMPIDSVDYVESLPPPVAPVNQSAQRLAALAEPSAGASKQTGKRLPHAPPHPPQPRQPAPASDADEPTRRYQRTGDLTQDFLSADVGFDPAPAIAPPDAAALMRAPISVRPPATSTRPNTPPTTRAPVSAKSATQENKGGGRGILFLLVAAAFGTGGYVLMHRVQPQLEAAPAQQSAPAATPTVEPSPATNPEPPTNPVTEPTPAPQASAAAITATANQAATTSTAALAPEPVAPVAAAAPPGEKSQKSHAEKPAHEVNSSSPSARSEEATSTAKAEPAATAPAATSTAAIEPRGPAGTDPFDVAAARSALEMSAEQASNCRKAGDPSGVAVVTITFSQTGRVTTATISGPPFQATPTGGCIASTLRKTRVPPFAGDMVTVRKTVTIE